MSEAEPKQLTCPNGHSFDAPASGEELSSVACPECDAQVDFSPKTPSDDGGSRGRGLWAMMGQTAAPDEPTEDSADESPEPTEESAESPPESEAKPIDDVAEANDDGESKSATPPDELQPPERPAFMMRTQKVVPVEPQKPATDASAPDSDDTSDEPPDQEADSAESESPSSDEADESPGRGLWAMMGVRKAEPQAESQPDTVEASDSESSLTTEEFDTAPPGDLDDEVPVPDQPVDDVADGGLDDNSELDDDDDGLIDEDEEDGWDVEDQQPDLDGLGSLLPPPEPSPDDGPVPGHGKGVAALALGILGAALAVLTYFPWFWVKVPCTLAGLGALVFGYQSIGERNRAREKKPAVVAMAGMAFGLAGMFAGPAFLNQLGEDHRERAASEAVKANLVQIGEALDRYYAEHARYPAGGDWEEMDGIQVGMHGWMTALLPYLEEDELVGAIDRTKPWDDPANFPAMSQPVATYLVPDVEHVPNSSGYATTHYAGVGGEILTEDGRFPLGVFDRESSVTLQDITDGRSQTVIAGEINRNYPPWGSPGNWRQTGRGLNKDIAGFGNADGTGAHFLLGDGSVRFFSNRTSPEVLDRLSTRDAGDEAVLPETQ